MRRTLVLLSVPTLAVAVSLLRLESPALLWEIAATCAFATVPALLPWAFARGAAAVVAGSLACWLAFGTAPWELLPGRDERWLASIRSQLDRGLLDFADQTVPLNPHERPEMHALVLVWLFALLLGIGLAVAARRTWLAAALLVAGAGWAATLVERQNELAVGALLLSAVLWLVLLERVPSRRGTAGRLIAGLGVVALAAGVSTSSAFSGEGALAWRDWDLLRIGGARVGVEYVWDADYSGIEFPGKPTTLLQVRAPRRALYWRASTLDVFTDDRWIESLYPVALGPAGRITDDPMLPRRAFAPEGWVRQEVHVEALYDDHLIGAATPMSVEGRGLGRLFYLEGGVSKVPRGLRSGQRYTVQSYVADPTPAQLRLARPAYPRQATRYLALDRAESPYFGAPGREAAVGRIFHDRRYEAIWPYRPLWQQAKQTAGGADSPYEATLAIERWLRADGGYRYAEQPLQARGTPPLADFAVRSRAGYCQHFAGTMALMLRLLGIPARVAVGFTSGTWKEGVWRVTDHDAHAWVEAWFEGWGWLPFDPTPGRGTISATYTLASDSADAILALGGERLLAPDGALRRARAASLDVIASGEEGRRAWPMVALAAILVCGVVALGLVKLARRRARYLTNDPRRLASAARAELGDWLADQGLDVTSTSTVRELVAKLELRLGVSGRSFGLAVSRARYGPPGDAHEAARAARRELRVVQRALRAALPPRRRLRGFVALASLRRS